MPSTKSPTRTAAAPSDITDSDIAKRAFELYCARGYEDGHDVEDWLNAERELREAASAKAS